ncbi:hypothetical protein [Marinobacterium sp. BA1]|uniref:hypothetical protein n=1 Tax=Marinobacterium sp. BA1 TaxID=3138931 RepID=UPI0032E570F8
MAVVFEIETCAGDTIICNIHGQGGRLGGGAAHLSDELQIEQARDSVDSTLFCFRSGLDSQAVFDLHTEEGRYDLPLDSVKTVKALRVGMIEPQPDDALAQKDQLPSLGM